jgi:hypothetical protein
METDTVPLHTEVWNLYDGLLWTDVAISKGNWEVGLLGKQKCTKKTTRVLTPHNALAEDNYLL